MSIDHLQTHYGFTRMPFGRGLAPGMLHRHRGHAEAVARIGWCVREHALGYSPARSAPAKPWPCAPPSPAWTPAATP